MKVICAGFPKTGTKSMAMALRELGYNSVHDFEEHYNYNLDNYVDYFEGRLEAKELMALYKDVDVVVDQPACTMWNIFFEAYPEAKVILMVRDSPEVWFQSYTKMLNYYADNFKVWYELWKPLLSRTYAKLYKLHRHNLIMSTNMPDIANWFDKSRHIEPIWTSKYLLHNAAVMQLVPPDQLLVYRVGEGWPRLCEFLGKEVPGRSFPKENVGGAKGATIVDKMVDFDVFQQADREVQRSVRIITGSAALMALLGIAAIYDKKFGLGSLLNVKKFW